jgi:hypothetical protein
MDLLTARREFQIRLYFWAKLKAADEIKEEFPHFWLFKGGASWKHYEFMRKLERREQELFVAAQLKRSHRYAVDILGETVSIEERAIEERWFKCNLEMSDFERDIAIRRRRGETIRFVSKRRLQQAMVSSFDKAFGHLGLEGRENIGHESSYVLMKCGDWVVQTGFYFGRTRSLISHSHVIVSEDRICHPTTPGVTGPALLLANGLCWIGLGRMEWDYLTDTDIEPACDSVVTLCREFFDELPKLLRGLERQKITTALGPSPVDRTGPS